MKTKLQAFILQALLLLSAVSCSNGKRIEVVSPDGKNIVTIASVRKAEGNKLPMFSLEHDKKTILLPSAININTGTKFTSPFTIVKEERDTVRNQWTNNFGERRDIPDNYNQVKIYVEGNGLKINFTYRAYNEGIAFTYEFPEQEGTDTIKIADEDISFSFESDYYAWSAARAQAKYSHVTLSKIEEGCERPLVIEIDSVNTIAIAEAKLVDYARMKFEPDTTSPGITIRSRLDSEVRKSLPFSSPWRVIMTGKNAGDLLEKNFLLLNLNDPCAISDISWIKPGKVLREVTLTTAGAKAAIDFTSSHNMQYVEFDAGWYGPENNDLSDASKVNLDPARSKGPLDMAEVVRYGKKKNIGILLYVNRRALEKQIDELLPLYNEWGIAGIKFGFVQVGNQDVTAWLHESIKKASAFNLIADVHDEYRPTGFSRTYPNLLTMEGIRGDEESPANQHTLITMFTRMLAGQGDNTICYYNERVDKKMGSHASQLAKAVCLFSPLQFMYWYDKASPSLVKKDGLWGATNYIGGEPELEFFNNVPTVWDNTKVLEAVIGEYGVIARKKGDEWFVGGINAEKPRTSDISFSFLDSNIKYITSVYSDDPSVNTRTHVRIEKIEIDRNSHYKATINPNNGFAMHIVPVK